MKTSSETDKDLKKLFKDLRKKSKKSIKIKSIKTN